MPLRFREAIPDDIPRLKAIRDNVTENVLTSASIEVPDYEKALLVDGKGWVCLDGTEVVGFSCGRLSAGDVWALFVDFRYEGRGIGGQLMELVENWMFSNGCQEITLTTDIGTRAEPLYRRRGWKPACILGEKEIRFRLRR
jgi:GNAT superfamily N-acetyltransferase